MEIKFYKFEDWFIQDPYERDWEKRVYVDENNKSITGVLENYFYFTKDDPKNHVYVEDGKRIYNRFIPSLNSPPLFI